jgi:hypothetical protein
MLVVICYGGKNGGVIGRLELEAGQSIAVPRGTRTIQVIDQPRPVKGATYDPGPEYGEVR